MENFKAWITAFLGTTGLNILEALLVLFFGMFLVRFITRMVKINLQKTPMERTTVSFTVTILNFALYLILFYLVLTTLFPGVSTGVIAILGSVALAVGLALKGSLSDFASGIIIIFTKPFREGEYVEIGNGGEIKGVVRSIGILTTELYSPDNKKVVINNSAVTGSQVVNFSSRPTRRVDIEVSAAYGSDTQTVKDVLQSIADTHPNVLKEPTPLIRMSEHAEYALKFRFRVWVNTADYWTVYYDLTESVYEKFHEHGILIPVKTMAVQLSGGKEANDE